jgi:hypothetical protein
MNLRILKAGLYLAVAVCVVAGIARAETNSASAETNPGAAPSSLPPDASASLLDAGFRDLYQLRFGEARSHFLGYQKVEPNDPLGKAAEAASYLYEEFNAKGVFSSAFFLNDSKLFGGVNGSASENRNAAFLETDHQARDMAKQRLGSNPQDARGLLVLTLADGMESDYDAIIEKKQLAGLGLMRQAEAEAARLLEIDPMAQDAYVALGASNYIVGCLPAYKRIFLRVGGIHGDRVRGMQQMQIAADHGRYLAPFAKILLALAFEREHQMDQARALLTDLTTQFPGNPLFAQELALAQGFSSQNR